MGVAAKQNIWRRPFAPEYTDYFRSFSAFHKPENNTKRPRELPPYKNCRKNALDDDYDIKLMFDNA